MTRAPEDAKSGFACGRVCGYFSRYDDDDITTVVGTVQEILFVLSGPGAFP